MRTLLLVGLISLVLPCKASAQFLEELRGVKLTNVDSQVLFSDAAIIEAMEFLAAAGFNAVLPVVQNGGYTIYPSAVMDLLETQQHPGVRLAATQVLMSISEQKGDLTAARDYLSQLSELQRGAGQPEDVVTSYASMMEDIFRTRPEQRFMKGSGIMEQSPTLTTQDPKDEPVLTIFPNPFNPETIVTIELRSEQRVRIEVYNTLGQRVQTLMDGQLTTGRHSVRMDGTGMASGVYLIRVHTSQQTLTQRVTLIK